MNKIKVWLGAGLFALLGLQSAGSFAAHLGCPDPAGFPTSSGCTLPGISGSGFPYFDQGISVKYRGKKNSDDFKLKANFDKDSNRSSLVLSDINSFDIDKTKFKVKVKVKNGVASGSVRIKGMITDLGMTKKETLMKAKLSGAWEVSADGQLLGFNTMDIECNVILPINCTTAESIFLALVNSINGQKNLKTVGVAITTVPVPAAFWLFGSGLISLAVAARRRSMAIG